MDNTDLIQSLNKELAIELPQRIAEDELLQVLTEFIDHLIQTDFEKLIFLLYKTDVSEGKLKSLLQQNSHEDAAPLIAKLVIERELQKINSRRQFTNNKDVPGEEKW